MAALKPEKRFYDARVPPCIGGFRRTGAANLDRNVVAGLSSQRERDFYTYSGPYSTSSTYPTHGRSFRQD